MSEPIGSLDLQDLKETFLECSVCLETFDQADKRPRLLEFCLHAFCTECLERLLAEEGKKQITCPMCRRVQKVTAVQSLPVDPVRNKLVDYVQLKNKKQVLCTACETDNAISRCEDCRSYLCNVCNHAHKRQKVTKGHTIVSLEQVLAQPIKTMSAGHICPKHESYKLEFYCTSDEQLCCVSCTVLDHKGHDLIGLDEAEAERRAEVETLLAHVSKKARDMRAAKEQMTKQKKQIVETKAKSTADIDSMFDTLRQALEQRKAILVASLDDKSTRLMTSIQKSADALDQSLAVIESTETYYDEAKGKADVVEMLKLYPSFKRSLTGIDEQKPPLNLTESLSSVTFQKAHEQQTLNDILVCGDLDKDFRQNNSSSSSYKLKTQPATASNTSSPRGKPMRATENVLGSWFSSLPSNMETSSGARALPKPPSSSIDSCPICMEPLLDPFKLDKCGHVFCKSCIRQAFDTKPVCPICGMVYGVLTGDQPSDGKMTYAIQSDLPIPGYRDARGTIVIDYNFPSGTQQANHPNPGRRYPSLHRTAYLPNNTKGKEVLELLKKAFQNKLTFTIGESRTRRITGVLTWNDIHHKTNLTGGVDNFGYPDPDYLKRVKEDLAAKGITN